MAACWARDVKPRGVSPTWLTAAQTFDVMLDRGEIDAAYGFAPRHDPKLFKLNIDRYAARPSRAIRALKNCLRRRAGGHRGFLQKTGMVPANHVIVAQRRLLQENSWLAASYTKIFDASKQAAYERTNFWGPAYLYFESNDQKTQAKTFGDDPFPVRSEQEPSDAEMLFATRTPKA